MGDSTEASLERALDPHTASRPTLLRGLWLRFGLVYWTLFYIPVLGNSSGFEWFGAAVRSVTDPSIVWVSKAILGITYEIGTGESGSGDRTTDWVFLLCIFFIAAVTAIAWSAIDRRRAHDDRLRALLRVLIRYMLGFIILNYGVMKLFASQFPAPSTGRLLQRYGDSSPMGLMWTFMGASPAYVVFSGAMETLGGLLVLFRRTTTLGALVLVTVLANIVMLNLCYDVPVKINSSHYLVMSGYLLIPMGRRLIDVLVLNRATQPIAQDLVLPRRWMRTARRILKYGMIAFVLVFTAKDGMRSGSATAVAPWYVDTWEITGFTRDGQDVPALVTDATRWNRIVFQLWRGELYARWRVMTDEFGPLYTIAADDAARTITLTLKSLDDGPKDSPTLIAFHYTRLEPDQLRLEGKLGTQAMVIELRRIDRSKMLLVNRGFHWISEQPFNR